MEHVFLLYGEGWGLLSVANSIEQLSELTDFFIQAFPNVTLSYQEWNTDEKSPRCWDWCYIASDSNPEDLSLGGGYIPKQHEWGKNIVHGYEADER